MTKNREKFIKRKSRIRVALKKRGGQKPRLSVFKSGKHIYAQIIDDVNSVTLVSASTKEKGVADTLSKSSNLEAARVVGRLLAEKALKTSEIIEVYFDRGAYIYHGKIKALADSAREAGLKF